MATPSMPTMPMQSIQCDPQLLAAAVVAQLSVGQPQQSQSQPQARILDRGAFASIYLLSATLPHTPKSFAVRVSTRPVYNPVARKQEKDKIRGYVGILLLIHARAPSSVRTLTPRILAYDASETCEFGHGWIAMTRLPGRPLSESWPELSPLQRDLVVRQLATFTKHLSSIGTSSDNGEDGETAEESWRAVGSLLVRGDCQTFSQLEPTTDRALHLDLELAPLLLPKRHGANNLRPVMPKAQPLTTSALLLEDDDDDDDYLSCYEVMLPTPSPPSSPTRVQFFPVGSAETEIPTSAVVKSCEDWLASIKNGMPEIAIIEVEDSSVEDLRGDSAEGGDPDYAYASLALWDLPSASDSSEETPYSTPMSTVLLLDDEDDSTAEDTFAISFTSTPAHLSVAAETRSPPPLLTLSIPVSNPLPKALEATKPFCRTSASSTKEFQGTRTPATNLPSTTVEMFHAALDAELAFLEEHQPAAARCFNNNMLRLAQCGMEDEVPRGAWPAVGKWDGYSAQLQALKGIVREVVGTQQQDEPIVLGRLGWDAADVLVQVEEDDDGKEQVMVTGVVDWEFAGVVPQWMVAGVPGFLRFSSSSTDDDCDDDTEQRAEQQEGDGVLPLWVENSTTWMLPMGIRHDDRLASVWRNTLDMDEEEDQWEKDELIRAAWKVANVEWHEVQRGCAWARGYLASRYRHKPSRSPVACHLDTQNECYLAVEVPSDGECSSGGRSRGTNDTQETSDSALPTTPTDDEVPLPTAAAPIEGGQALSFVGVFLSVEYSAKNGDDEEESEDEEGSEEEEEEEEDYESSSGSHDWRDEFESAFMFSAPFPSHPLRTSSTLLHPSISRVAQQKQKQMAEERKREKQNFEKAMNDPLPHAGYEVLWEVPPQPSMADLEFLVERDLDAGW